MPALLLTSENYAFTKRSLRTLLPEVRSAHLSEALARLFSYHTHAALLSALNNNAGSRPILLSVDVLQFYTRLNELGYENVDANFSIDVLRSSEMPEPLWREYKDEDQQANDAWFRECRRRNIPNVYIKQRIKYVELNWDCISTDNNWDDRVLGNSGDILMRSMFKRYQMLVKPDPGKSEFFGSGFVGSIDCLLPNVARNIADEIFSILYEPVMQEAVL